MRRIVKVEPFFHNRAIFALVCPGRRKPDVELPEDPVIRVVRLWKLLDALGKGLNGEDETAIGDRRAG